MTWLQNANKNHTVEILYQTEPSSRGESHDAYAIRCFCIFTSVPTQLAAITTHQKRDTPTSRHKQTNQNLQQPKFNQPPVLKAQTQRNNNSPTKPKLLNKQTKHVILHAQSTCTALGAYGFDWRWYCAKFFRIRWWARWRGSRRIYSLFLLRNLCLTFI